MKRLFILVLCAALFVQLLPAFAESMPAAGDPGDVVSVTFTLLENPGGATIATVELIYDHSVLELVPNQDFKHDKKAGLPLQFFTPGMSLTASFRILEGASPGEYAVTLETADALREDYSDAPALVFDRQSVCVSPSSASFTVIYLDSADGSVLKTEALELAPGTDYVISAVPIDGYRIPDGLAGSVTVHVSPDGTATPASVTFWMSRIPAVTPTPAPALRVGETVFFGHYEQDGITGNGQEAIEWIVLDVQDGNALLISYYALDSRPYNASQGEVVWQRCTLRSWLNDSFLNAAFTPAEQNAIQLTTVSNAQGQGYGKWSRSGGSDTQDRVFLLSYAQAWQYFLSEDARSCLPTVYARNRGAYANRYTGNCYWWLRSPGYGPRAAAVMEYGTLDAFHVDLSDGAVRPALWVRLDSGYLY